MLQQDVAAELGQDGARELLATATLLRLAYNAPDASPRVIPIGFFWNSTAVILCTAVTSPKVSALQANPAVALTIDVGDTPANARSLLLRGAATVEIVDGVPREYLDASRKSLDHDQFAGFEAAVSKMYPQMARISVAPSWARYYDFGAGRLPRFLQKMAEEAARD